jgi:NADH dehydrogenase (ubiquinone) 1 beta subcomplex subunit 7
MKVSVEEMDKARIPPAWRDYCAHLLVPLNQCRLTSYSLPWKCVQERHAFEECEYRE